MTDEQPKNHVEGIYRALGGRPILLPIKRGEKGPKWDAWEKTTWENTQDPAWQIHFSREKRDSDGDSIKGPDGSPMREVYRSEGYADALHLGNVGVMLGGASVLDEGGKRYHLCSIDIDTDEEMSPFLEANPKLKAALRTRGRRGGNIWLWIEAGSYPPMARLKFADGRKGANDKPLGWGEWRSETPASDGQPGRRFQTVIWGVHPEGNKYERVSDGLHPLRLNFSDIVWPESVEVPWRKSPFEVLCEKYGQPWAKSKNGALTINPPFFVAKYADEHDVLFEPEESRFYDYCAERGLWIEDSEDRICWKFSDDFKRVADEADEPGLELKRTNAFLRGLASQLKGCVEKRQAFTREAGVVHLLNGMLDVRQNPPTLSSFGKHYFSRNQLAVALNETAQCPRFMKELLADAVEPEDIRLLQKWAGQLLLGVNLTQRIMLLTGAAGRGKSTFINLMAKLIGQANYAGLRTEHLHQRFELFNYVGKTFLIGADVPGNFLMTEGAHVLKALVGKDVLTAEKKNGESMNIIGDFNIGMTSNSRLKVKLDGDTDAWRRRLIIVNYERAAPAAPDPLFLENLIASEASGILNWMIEGAMILLAEIKSAGRLVLTPRQQDRVDSLLAESDSIKQFVRKGIATADVSNSLTTHELCEAYVHYCEDRGWNPLPTRKVEQTLPDAILEIHRLARRNDVPRDGKNQRGYKGLRLLVEADRSAPGEEPDNGGAY